MIGKTTKGSGFGGLLRYVFEKEGAKYIGGNMAGTTPEELGREFRALASRNHRVLFPVAHISFSPSPLEHLDEKTALLFATRYMEEISFGDCQWVLAGHDDTTTPQGQNRPHFHIIANRVRMTDALVVTAWLDWKRSEKALRKLEKEFGLIEVQPSLLIDKSAPSTGQQRRYKREKSEFEEGERLSPPSQSIKVQLQQAIDEQASLCPAMPELIARLNASGIEAQVVFTRTGKVKGITYSLNGVNFSGTQLGRAYTFPGLQKHRGISYDSTRDLDTIKQLCDSEALLLTADRSVEANANITQELENTIADTDILGDTREQQRIQFIAALLADYLLEKKAQRLEGKHYTTYWESDELVLVTNSDSSQILRARYKESRWESIGTLQLNDAHFKDFQEIALFIQQARANAIAPVAIRLFETSQEVTAPRPGIGRLEGTHYILTDDQFAQTFSIQSKDGRGELVRVNRHERNALLSAQGIDIRDLANFQRIERAIDQKRGKEKQRQIE